MVGFKTMTNDLSLIIAADDQLIAADVANVLHARRICLNVIGCTAAQADTAAGHALFDDVVCNFKSRSAVDVSNLVE